MLVKKPTDLKLNLPLSRRLSSIDALTLQVNEIKSLLTTILKGKAKEIDPEDMILEPPKAGGSKASVSKMSKKKKKPAHRSRSASKSSRSERKGSERSGRSSSSSSSPSPSRSPHLPPY